MPEKPTKQEKSELDEIAAANPHLDPESIYRPTAEQKPRGWIRRHKKGLGIGGGLTILTIVFGFFISSGPLELLHAGELLKQFHFAQNETAMDSRFTRAYRYAKYPKSPAMRRLGVIRNTWANKMEARLLRETGVRPIVEDGYLQGWDVVEPGKINRTDLDTQNIRYDVDADGNPTRIHFEVDDVNLTQSNSRRFIRYLLKTSGYSKVVSAVSARPLKTRYKAGFSVFGKITRRVEENFRQRFRQQRTGELKQGAREYDVTARQAGEDAADSEKARAEQRQEVADSTKEFTGDADTPAERVANAKSKIRSRATGGVVVLGLVCLVDGIKKQAENVEYYNSQLPLGRLAVRVIVAADQLRHGETVNYEELQEEMEFFYNEQNKTSWHDARSIQHEQGNRVAGPDIPESAKFGGAESINNSILGKISGFPGVGAVCSVATSAAGQFLSFAIEKVIFGWAAAVKDFLISEAISRTPLFDTLANIAAGEQVNVEAEGAEFGNNINYGARLAANDQALTTGGRILDSAEEAQLRGYTDEVIRQDFASESWPNKLFSRSHPQSFFSKIALAWPRPSQIFQSFNISNLSVLIASGTSSDAQAATTYDYGFPKIGFTVDELQDRRWENPLENEEWLDGKIDSEWTDARGQRRDPLDEEYGEPCFGITINEDGSLEYGEAKGYSGERKIDPKCKGNDEALLRYRVYLLDLTTQTTMACYEGDEQSCINIGIPVEEAAIGGIGECGSLPGNEEILCEALKYDDLGYDNTTSPPGGHLDPAVWLKNCRNLDPQDPNCKTDCSGLVLLSVYDAFGVNEFNQTSHTYPSSSNWKKIDFSDVQPGDIVGHPGHVAIVEGKNGDTIEIFQASTSHAPLPDQINHSDCSASSGCGWGAEGYALRYVGKGSEQ